MRRGGRVVGVVALVALASLTAACAQPIVGVDPPTAGEPVPAPAAAVLSTAGCDLPSGSDAFTRADPAAVDLTRDAVTRAVEYASATGAQSLRIYRRDCLVATSGNDQLTEWVPLPVWSMTKGVVGMIVGRAVQLGFMSVDDPIGAHLQIADPAKAALTVRHFLTQTSGLRMAWVSDLIEAATTDSARAVLARPFEALPGTTFLYAQTAVTALVAVVEAATGEDLQAFARREVFAPIGIRDSEWRWDRDGVGRTQGFGFLDMTPLAVARLGTLLLHGGEWSGRRLLPAEFVAAGARGTEANPCYGYLWWTNHGDTCRNGGVPADQLYERRWIPSAPPDAFGLSGMFDQTVVVIPSLDLVVVRMGLPPEIMWDPLGLVADQRPDWEYRLFRILLSGITDTPVADPGEWTPDPPEPPGDWSHIFEVPLPAP